MTEPTDAEKRAVLKNRLNSWMDEVIAEQRRKDSNPDYVQGRMEQAKSTLWQLENLDNPVEGLTLDKVIGVLRNIVKRDEEMLNESKPGTSKELRKGHAHPQ